ncbi:MAG: cyclomaltodextrinase [Erysipelotrichaceae bacterium]|nr:cyclomaltodextrinase [Erysipelotrichaceae bacterium]
MWAYESVFYQIYPLGFCNAPFENDGNRVNRIKKVIDWIPHLQQMGVNAVYFSPIFESDTHGYNTRDYYHVDCRLGSDEDFAYVSQKLHEAGIRVVLDGVFNHVGRGFWAFQDVLRYREGSRYKDWFNINFGGNSPYNDGLWYEGWEGNYDLVKLNLYNDEVVHHIFDAIKSWVDRFGIDGLRLDVAYCLQPDFLKKLRRFTNTIRADFFLVGETLHGDYNRWMNDEMCHSVTNYECYKGLYSALNSMNLFEICHSLGRQFGPENWTLYKGRHLLTFLDNHDVNRIASTITNENHLPLAYALAFGMPGIPCVYYGSEWGSKGVKNYNDTSLRPSFEKPEWNALTDWITKLTEVKKNEKALNYGDYHQVLLTNRQCIFERTYQGERVLVVVNADTQEYEARFNMNAQLYDLIEKKNVSCNGGIKLPAYSATYYKVL